MPHLVAPVVEASEDLREREESNLGQLLAAHEIRNVCSAIAVVHENLVRGGTLRGNKDFRAPGALVDTAPVGRAFSLPLYTQAFYTQAVRACSMAWATSSAERDPSTRRTTEGPYQSMTGPVSSR